MYSAVLFDLDNTLIDRDGAFRELVRETFRSHEAVEELVELDRSGYGNALRLFDRWEELGGGKLDRQRFGLAIAEFVRSQPELSLELSILSNICEIGIISNGSTVTQRAKWRASGLDEIIPLDRLWISEEVGFSKPNPAIFRLACEAINVDPIHCLYMGDQPEIDIEGARSAGLQTMLVDSPIRPRMIAELASRVLRWTLIETKQ